MKKTNYLFVFTFFFTLTLVHAQYKKCDPDFLKKATFTIETETNNTINKGLGYFFMLDVSKNHSQFYYTVIITRKSLIINSKEIKLIFQKSSFEPPLEEPFTVIIPNDSLLITPHPNPQIDLVYIRTRQLQVEFDKKKLDFQPLSLIDECIQEIGDEFKESDLDAFKEIMRKKYGIVDPVESKRYFISNKK
jgi:hypothetical protein